MSYQPPQPQVVYQRPLPPPINAMAVTSLILGVIGGLIGIWSPVPIFGIVAGAVAFLPAILAIFFGHAGLRTARQTGSGRGVAVTGLVFGYVTIAIVVAATLFWVWLLSLP